MLIGQKDKRPLEAVQTFLKGEGFVNPILYLRRQCRRSSTTLGEPTEIWMLAMNRREDTTRFLTALLPFLIQKREQAERVLLLLEDWKINLLPVNVEEAVRLRESGMTWQQVASAMGFGTQKVVYAVRAAGRPTNQETAFRVDWPLVRRLHAEGLTYTQIAARTGYKRGTVRDLTRKRRAGKHTGKPVD